MMVSSFLQKLIEYDIHTGLLIEFYEEVAETEKLFNGLVEDIISPAELEEKQISVAAIERFCVILKELQIRYSSILDYPTFSSDDAKREIMIENAERFVHLLEKDTKVKLPDRPF
jgi:hypothetical protein